MGKRLALVGLAFLLAHCADAYTGAPLGSGGPGGPGSGLDGGVDGAASSRLALAAVPDIIVVPGSTVAVPVSITRTGIEGPVVVSVTDAPAGVSMSPATVAANETAASITVAVAAGTTFPATKVTFVATSGEERAPQTTNLLLRGKAGAVDDSFGSQGVAEGVLRSGEATDLAIRADGSYVILANAKDRAVLAPVTRDGEATTSPSALAFASAGAIAVEPSGGLVVGGLDIATMGNALSLRRYRSPSLDVDMAFGEAGRVLLADAGMASSVRDIVVRDTGFLVLHDATRPRVTAVSFAGALETAWGTAGATELVAGSALSLVPLAKSWVAFSFDSARTAYSAMPIGPSGTAGNAARVATSTAAVSGVRPRGASDGSTTYLPVVDTSTASYGLSRYDGALATVSVDVTSPGLGAVVQPDGKVVVVFVSLQRIVLGRFDPRTGTRDLAFGATGVVGVPIERASSPRIYLQPDGRLVGFANVAMDKESSVSMFRMWL